MTDEPAPRRPEPGERPAAALDALPESDEETLGDALTYWRYRAVWAAAAGLPEPLARRAPGGLGRLWHRLAPDGQREQVRRNLARAAGHPSEAELERIVRAAYVSYARYWLDAFRLHTMDRDDVLSRTTEEDLDRIDDLLADGRGAILATGHLGSWDVGAFFSAPRGWGMAVVAEVLEPRRLFERFVWLREQAGIEVYPLVRGGDMIDRLEQVVRGGGLATLLADRDLTRKGPIVDFFGEPCRLPPGPAALARRTGRPVVVGAFVTEGRDRYRAVVQDVVEISDLSVEDGTQVVARVLEELIGRFPEQWHVFVRNWLADREPEHPRIAGQAGATGTGGR